MGTACRLVVSVLSGRVDRPPAVGSQAAPRCTMHALPAGSGMLHTDCIPHAAGSLHVHMSGLHKRSPAPAVL